MRDQSNHNVKSSELYCPVSSDELELFKRRWAPEQFRKDQTLFYAKHLPYGVYVLHEGSIVLECDQTREQSQRIKLKRPCLLGLDLIFTEGRYPMTAICLDHALISFIEKNEVEMSLRRERGPIIEVLKKLGKRSLIS